MPRNRMLKKDFFGDPKVGNLPLGCRLLFQSLWIFADDTGHGIADARLLKAQCFPYDPEITPDQVQSWLDLLSQTDMVRQYQIAGQKYFEVVNFAKHQIINRPSGFAYPKPNHRAITEDSLSAPVPLTDEVVSTPVPLTDERERKRVKGKNKGNKECAGARGHFANRKMDDPRFIAVRDLYITEFEKKAPGLKAPFDARDAKLLSYLLKRQPKVNFEDLASWLRNAFASEATYPLQANFRLREFCSHAEKYSDGPLKRAGAAARRPATMSEDRASAIDGLVMS
jgi:hypothetical protein